MATASALVHGGVAAALQAEEETAAAAAPQWPAALAERYERLEKLGEGMFGDVYRAWDRVGRRFVAVKRLAGRAGGGFVETCARDFSREAASLAACRGHPSVVELLAAHAAADGGAGVDRFLVTECAGPTNLRQYMDLRRREGRLPFDEAEVRDAMRQLLAGAEAAHAAGVLHREIVPENVTVDAIAGGGAAVEKKVVYKICGFGMSEPAAEKDVDGDGMLASPGPYRAPELFLGSKDYDGRVDTWALGCIMAELLAGAGGAPFFGGETDAEVLEKMLRVVGARGIVKWPGLERVAGQERAARLRKMFRRDGGHLREVFPKELLSPEGFEVLSGLLRSDPDSRLTAAAALRMPWFRRRRGFGGCFRGAAS
ncbi:unnamed protein product [Urochloa decumbens]|uniref:[RNA-polymerase]-subunit kinase n=1 Tax=Urochloa decumbens TaxID=240449 RepID=A0ABC9H9N9_9POAL